MALVNVIEPVRAAVQRASRTMAYDRFGIRRTYTLQIATVGETTGYKGSNDLQKSVFKVIITSPSIRRTMYAE